jgi:acylphosphatase
MTDQHVRLTAWVSGRVQGVGFRWWTRRQAQQLGLVGTATNLPDGRVEVVAEGPRPACERLAGLLESSGTPGQVAKVTVRYSEPEGGFAGFSER